MFWCIFALLTGLKLLLIPSYRSTDFEVHRNWLAITNSQPLSKWYYEDTSPWTLDYPPFFAYFEWGLSQVAKFVDVSMLNVKNLNYDSTETILFQRLSVIVTDVVYAIAVKKCVTALTPKSAFNNTVGAVALVSNVGLLFVDHIHFQYNGFLFGIFLLSISCLLENKPLQCALWFSVLLNLKHIFVYCAPSIGVYLLRFYCMDSKIPFWRFGSLLAIAGSCIVASFGPFYNHLPQVFSRLFPFKRGLTHSYWAPNCWALYNFADKIVSVALKKSTSGSNTGGLVQQYNHSALFSINPLTTFILTAIFMLPCIVKLFVFTEKRHAKETCLRVIVICCLTSFLFGWHVHEKAILMVIIPLGLLALVNSKDAGQFVVLTIIGHYSLFPLLFPKELIVIKYFLFIAYHLAILFCLKRIHPSLSLPLYKEMYIFGFFVLTFYEIIGQYIMKYDQTMPFLPLMLTSVYCSIGVCYFYIDYYYALLCTHSLIDKKVK